ncbi:COG1470 family protein [Streptomyces goshikiensis]|uniref:COG1470 family protein n=1 Tax=Streptomyces goshikiensis TaxID=1942 RepID=UPI0036DDFEDE
MNSCLRARGSATATRRARFPALWSLLLTGLVLALAPGAQAAPAPVPSPAPPASAAGAPFGVRAGLYGLTTLTGGHFGYALKAGARIEDSAVIHNESDEARTFHVYGADVSNAAGGGLAPAQEGQRMRAVGAWLKLDSEATVTVRPKSSATVRFSLAVPDGTPPGSYLGSLVTALRTPAVSGQVNTETRIARLVQLTVPGTADLQVSLTELEHRPAGGGEEFTVTVRNTGNVLYTFDDDAAVIAIRRAAPAPPPSDPAASGGRTQLGVASVAHRATARRSRSRSERPTPSHHLCPKAAGTKIRAISGTAPCKEPRTAVSPAQNGCRCCTTSRPRTSWAATLPRSWGSSRDTKSSTVHGCCLTSQRPSKGWLLNLKT